jgi:hypothetical protein
LTIQTAAERTGPQTLFSLGVVSEGSAFALVWIKSRTRRTTAPSS